MKEISRAKRLEVAHYYLLGYSYKEIEVETGVSHGLIAGLRHKSFSVKLVSELGVFYRKHANAYPTKPLS